MIIEKNIHKFITHVVNNLFPLNEYQEGEIKFLMDKFKIQADDLNIDISDTQLLQYIKRFDQLKDNQPPENRNLRNWSLSDLIRLGSKSKGADVKDKEVGPDVLYSENGITVYSGETEELCQRHRFDVKWCITNSAFLRYRLSGVSFYLIKNNTDKYKDDEKLSFVAIQVRNTTNEKEKYIWTPKDNDPNESPKMGWSKLTSDIPWLTQIPNIKNILEYIPFNSTEQVKKFKDNEITIREWSNLPFEIKKQYLVIRKELKILFEDITIDEFVSKYLPKYPQISTFIAKNAGIIESKILFKNLDKFSDDDRESIIRNSRELFKTDELSKDFLPFDVKLLLTKLKKWNLSSDERIYITKNNEAIIKLKFTPGSDNVQMGVFTAEDSYPNVKLNTRTSKYLLDYPEIDKIPFNTLIKLTNNEVIDKSFIEKIIVKAEEDPNSAIVVKNVEDGKILLDSNSFTSYKIKDGKISSIPFNDEEVQKVLNTETENTGFQESAVNLVFQQKDLSPLIDKDAFLDILKNTPYNKRTKDGSVILINDSETGNPIFAMPTEIPLNIKTSFSYGGGTWNNYFSRTQNLDEDTIKPYFNYLRSKNVGFNDETLIRWLDSSYTSLAKKIISSNPPMDPNSIYYPAVIEDKYVLINKSNPSASKAIGKNKIIRANVPPNIAREITGVGAEQTPRAPRTPRSAAPQAAVAPNATVNAALDFNRLTAGFNSLPTSIKSRIGGGDIVPYTRRNASVDAIGRVRSFIQNGQSKFYIIRLNSGTIIGFATMQPDARHYIVTSTTSYQVPRVGQLASVLQQRNISEGTKTALRLHASAYPEEANEIKKILQKLKIK
jgi:hypothetical protein